ncbi:MAG: Fic family protein [Ferruginibacter sp.]
MSNTIYSFAFTPNWMHLTNQISQIDRFDASWSTIEKREGQTLKQLKAIATVRSVGASTRIEGSRMTDDEVSVLISNLSISTLEERDQQEVAGYFEALELIAGSFRDMDITENNLKHLHNTLMKYSEKDSWHKGNYKQHSNVVEAVNGDGSKQVIFKTTAPGLATEDAMSKLIAWYRSDTQTLPLIKAAVFIYDFLSIHPFQDGNGRLSRLLGSLLLLKQGYSWIQYVSFEHEIENRKSAYYKILMQCQRQRPGEDVHPWVTFFLDCLKNIQSQLMAKLDVQTKNGMLTQKEKKIYSFIENHPGCKSGEIAIKLDTPQPTVKRLLTEMVKNKLLVMHGAGAGTNYSIEATAILKKDAAMRFTNKERKKEITLVSQGSFIEIRKIILTPIFTWSHPDEWSNLLMKNGLYIQVTCTNKNGIIVSQPYSVSSYNSPYYYQPVFSLSQAIVIPDSLWEKTISKKDFPISVTIELLGTTENFDFDVMLVYDEA